MIDLPSGRICNQVDLEPRYLPSGLICNRLDVEPKFPGLVVAYETS